MDKHSINGTPKLYFDDNDNEMIKAYNKIYDTYDYYINKIDGTPEEIATDVCDILRKWAYLKRNFESF